MPPKRRAVVESDNEDHHSVPSPSTKRARVDARQQEGRSQPAPSGENLEPPPARARARRQPRDAAGEENIDVDIEDDESDVVEFRDQTAEEDEGAQAQFEQEHEETIRESIRQRNKMQGGVAKFGIIEAIEMHQFMCHKYLTFKFGPQINFIIGHNGSGKSAVLSAITVALGGKATSTGRGNGLKAFIREGQSVSEVSIQLKNQGEEAYKHDVYGDSIIVTRRFTKEGASSYKIKSRDGKVISTKREELSAICDHMNIQVDNPMNVLTQDAARQFLSASHPSDKYRFFLKGTQLSQLSEEYETCLENISQTTKVLMRKKEAIPDLHAHFKEASARFQEASKARQQRHKADELKKELAWAHVAAKEEELREKVKETAKAESRIPKIEKSLADAEASFAAATTEVETLEQEHEKLGNIEHLHQRKTELQAEINGNKRKILDLKADERRINDELTSTKRQIAELDKRMKEEAAKSAAHSEAKVDQLHQRLESIREEFRQTEERLKASLTEGQAKDDESKSVKTNGDNLRRELESAKRDYSDAEEQIQRCIDNERNSLAPFGKAMNAVLEQISRMRWQGQKPVGPLGVYVKVTDPKWAPLLRIVLGGLMSSFAVTDSRDLPALKKLLKDSGNHHCQIIVSEVDLFDYREGELDRQYLTILRAIECSDEYVLRVLINQAKIERTLLANTRADADQQLSEVRGGGSGLSADLYRVTRFSDGGGTSSTMNALRSNDPKNFLFMNKDAASQVDHYRELARQAEAKVHELIRQDRELHEKYDHLQRAISTLRSQGNSFKTSLARLKRQREQIQSEINENVLPESSGLDVALQEMEKEKDTLVDQFTGVTRQKEKLNEVQAPLLLELNDIKRQESEFDGLRQAATARIEGAVERRLEAQNAQKHWANKVVEEGRKVAEVKERENLVQQEFEAWTAKAEEYCARVDNPRKAEVVQRNLDSVQTALKEREKRHGATVEEMTIEVNRAKTALDTAQKDLKTMAALNRALKQSLRIRLEKWYDFRRHIAFRCKVVFQYHLSNRGYFGKVLFNHVDGTLSLKVQTDDLNSTQGGGSRDKDPRSLSGGEKSFATICLLLAMWESIGSPIRCLDEFDVFMDAVNRRISMKMMIDTANSSDGKQYILITPQSMQNIHVGTTVRVHRMSDPERGQGTLAYGNSVA
ncbi:P-loop containing nucleoside triphosphate hydrolase protein [Auriscalpium vulgare]|uniref:P-loop containing nucleoside triphosphate hydrolase protein n=1 Tax=Auriscalpium vulgare TaxID=40419 RepID=A0ACB8S443_9AGAM|nr:P-loop containing nucleoside triphosphate hydrolase protein [Auriscalpium vulgare]